MLQTQTSNLPPEQQRRLHADFLANEQDYLRMRAGLLTTHAGQWVAVADGRLITSGNDLMEVMEQAANHSGHPYVAKVGDEDRVVFKVRREEFTYDTAYGPFALPHCTVTFWNHAETLSRTFADVIPDTGSDMSILPDADCVSLDLYNSPYFTTLASGIVGGGMATLVYRGKAEINGKRVVALIRPLTTNQERIAGRDILNHHRVVSTGPDNAWSSNREDDRHKWSHVRKVRRGLASPGTCHKRKYAQAVRQALALAERVIHRGNQ